MDEIKKEDLLPEEGAAEENKTEPVSDAEAVAETAEAVAEPVAEGEAVAETAEAATEGETVAEPAAEGEAVAEPVAEGEGECEGTCVCAAPKKRMGRVAVCLLSVFLTLLLVSGAFFTASYLVKEADLLHVFHARVDTEGAETVAANAFQAMYYDLDFVKYVELLPPLARDAFVEQVVTQNGVDSIEAFAELFRKTQEENYADIVFELTESQTMSLYTDEYIKTALETDTSLMLFGTPYTAEDVEAIAEVQLTVNMTMAEQEYPQTIPFTVAQIDSVWYVIS